MKILLFGSGYMAGEYMKVLKTFKADVTVIARDADKARKTAALFGFEGMGGGVAALKKIDVSGIHYVINAASVDSLTEINLACLKVGLKNILVEKPGALNVQELQKVKKAAGNKAKVHIAYNRRFYNSVLELQKSIKADGKIQGCFFDFTDREKDIFKNLWSSTVVKRWGWANAAHVIDLAFFLIGTPKQINVLKSGGYKGVHAGSTFTGSGKSAQCLFSYFATWAGGGRWNLEISTPKGRYKLSPLEELRFCVKNQFDWESVPFSDQDDAKFKPGLFKMVKAVIMDGDLRRLPDLNKQIQFCHTVDKVFGYGK